jgi:hypothetical protein
LAQIILTRRFSVTQKELQNRQFAAELFGSEESECHRDIERTREISLLYSLLIDHPGRWLGVAPGAAGTVGTLSLTLPK